MDALLFYMTSIVLSSILQAELNIVAVADAVSFCLFDYQAEPPAIVVATIGSLCQMLEKQFLKLESLQVLVIDEVKVK